MMINKNAPVAALGEIEISSDPKAVWDVMTAIDSWPSWNPEIKSAHLNGEFAKGSSFEWESGPGTVGSTIQEVEPLRTLAWTGKTLGIKAIHVWHLEPLGDKTMPFNAGSLNLKSRI
jgi:uncharacterized protein YndB with AHSA1/START domain